jgi:arylsulfatase
LAARWWVEAGVNGVLPLEERTVTLRGKPDAEPRWDKATFTYLPGAILPDTAIGPDLFNRGFRIAADVTAFQPNDEGVLLAIGDRFAGFSLFIQDERLVFDYNASGEHSLVATSNRIPPATTLLELYVAPIQPGSAEAILFLDRRPDGDDTINPTIIRGVSLTGVQCGRGYLTPVSNRYTNTFCYTGGLRRVTITLGPKALDADERPSR